MYQPQWLGQWTKSCLLVVCMWWTHLALVWPAASLYSASPPKHHATGRQWCPNPDHYPDFEPASRALTPLCWALSTAAEPQILTSFVWRGRRSNHQLPACQANAQPLHYPATVRMERYLYWNVRVASFLKWKVLNCRNHSHIQGMETLDN